MSLAVIQPEAADLGDKICRAFERRLGRRPADFSIRQVRSGLYRITDLETGSWAEYDTSWWRIRRVAEGSNPA